jgi:hypothetical protein
MNNYQVFSGTPDEIPEHVLPQMILLGEEFGEYNSNKKPIGSDIGSRILSSKQVIWVMDGDFLAGMATLVDSNEDIWMGVNVRRSVEMQIGKDLGPRNERRLFAVSEKYQWTGVEDLIESELDIIDPNIFVLCNTSDNYLMKELKEYEYLLVGKYISHYSDKEIGVGVNQ